MDQTDLLHPQVSCRLELNAENFHESWWFCHLYRFTELLTLWLNWPAINISIIIIFFFDSTAEEFLPNEYYKFQVAITCKHSKTAHLNNDKIATKTNRKQTRVQGGGRQEIGEMVGEWYTRCVLDDDNETTFIFHPFERRNEATTLSEGEENKWTVVGDLCESHHHQMDCNPRWDDCKSRWFIAETPRCLLK